jgi:hypothetical protein
MSDLIDIDERPWIVHELEADLVHDGDRPRLVPVDAPKWRTELAKMRGRVKVSIERWRRRRSHEANAYYWGVVLKDILIGLRAEAVRVGEECPFDDDEDLHDALKYIYFGRDSVTFRGKRVQRQARTRKLDSKQYAAFVDYARRWAATEWNIYTREAGEAGLA